ncbi:YHYH domain-containing protein [Fuerstiella marisgermanici]|uniref:Uncharacterized protein n=1 Tax=Fuerstiella marisgermanici TaxID=1891926 RepID=A0A1P8WHG3_9PLAN|nr:YHYH domain-containing protein [Fuerstiella marisgermanici]APZ93483.1 hypothetical protein Fuma_03101 [Fuerstiella marisgermanici]
MKYLALLFTILITGVAQAHSGGTDARGGHYDRKNGGYHFDGGGGQSSSTAQRISALKSNFGSNFDTYSSVPKSSEERHTELKPNARLRPRDVSPRSKVRTAARSSPRVSSRDRVRVRTPREKPPSLLEYVAPDVPRHEILNKEDHIGVPKYSIAVDYDTGMPRPTKDALERLVTQLAEKKRAEAEIRLPRGTHANAVWAKLLILPNHSRTDFMPYGTDFEVFGIQKFRNENAIQVFVYPGSGSLPTEHELTRYADGIDLPARQLVLFYLPRMNPAAGCWAMYRVGGRGTFRIYPERVPEPWQES